MYTHLFRCTQSQNLDHLSDSQSNRICCLWIWYNVHNQIGYDIYNARTKTTCFRWVVLDLLLFIQKTHFRVQQPIDTTRELFRTPTKFEIGFFVCLLTKTRHRINSICYSWNRFDLTIGSFPRILGRTRITRTDLIQCVHPICYDVRIGFVSFVDKTCHRINSICYSWKRFDLTIDCWQLLLDCHRPTRTLLRRFGFNWLLKVYLLLS